MLYAFVYSHLNLSREPVPRCRSGAQINVEKLVSISPWRLTNYKHPVLLWVARRAGETRYSSPRRMDSSVEAKFGGPILNRCLVAKHILHFGVQLIGVGIDQFRVARLMASRIFSRK